VNLEELRQLRKEIEQRMNAILDKADSEKRDLSQNEERDYKAIMAEFEDVCDQINVFQRASDRGYRGDSRDVVRRYVPQPMDQESRSKDRLTAKDVEGYSLTRAIQTLAENRPLDGLEGELSREMVIRSGKAPESPRAFHVPLQALETRALSAGAADNGAKTVFTEEGGFIEILRNRLVTAQLGAEVFTNLRGDISFPKQTAKATAAWKTETGALDEQDQDIGQVLLAPNKVGAFTEYSTQLMHQSSIQVEQFVRRDLSRAIAESIDAAAINGSGSGSEPTGILNTVGIGAVLGGTNGAAPDWDHIVDLETSLGDSDADAGRLAYLTNSAVRGKLKKTFVDSSSNAERVWDNRTPMNPLNGYAAGVSNLVPRNLDKGTASGICSALIFGNWEDLMIGFWGDSVSLLVNPYSKDTQGLIRITAWSFADIGLRNAQSFAAMQDALTA
jgi:HK97 family phage major capsid protein